MVGKRVLKHGRHMRAIGRINVNLAAIGTERSWRAMRSELWSDIIFFLRIETRKVKNFSINFNSKNFHFYPEPNFLSEIKESGTNSKRIAQSQSRIIENVNQPFWNLRLWLVDSRFSVFFCPFLLTQINFNLDWTYSLSFFLIFRAKKK